MTFVNLPNAFSLSCFHATISPIRTPLSAYTGSLGSSSEQCPTVTQPADHCVIIATRRTHAGVAASRVSAARTAAASVVGQNGGSEARR
jgi:hypothetical protein